MLKKLIKLLFAALLLALAIAATLYHAYRVEGRFFSLTHSHHRNQLQGAIDSEIFSSDSVVGKFLAREKNLGTVGVRFDTHYRVNEDVLIFRIREYGQTSWHYENFYKVDQFQPKSIFPFGFPVIEDSKNKFYEFEIISLSGSPGNAVSISRLEPAFVSIYEHKNNFYGSPNLQGSSCPLSIFRKLMSLNIYFNKVFSDFFIFKKIVNILTLSEYRNLLFVYITPLVLIVLINAFRIDFPKIYSKIIILPIFYTLIKNRDNHDGIYFLTLVLWLYVVKVYKPKTDVTFKFSLVFFIFSALSYLIYNLSLSEKFAVWSFLGLSFAITQKIFINLSKKVTL